MSKKTRLRSILALALSLVMLLGITPITASASSPSIRGYSTSAQTVYTGPSSSYYVSVGSIGNGERVYILGKEQGWYHIVYDVNSGGQKSGYVPMNSIRDISGGTPVEDDFWGGYAISNSTQTVYSCDDYSTKIRIGGISSQEGVTRLYGYNSTASNGQTYSVLFIEYSTSSGAKRGYVFNPNFSYPYSETCVGRMSMGCNTYYGAYDGLSYWGSGTTFGKAGFVGDGEYVAVLAKNENSMYIEYNTSQGRKRGHVSSTYVRLYNSPGHFADIPFYSSGSITLGTTYQDVRSGPGSAYPIIGSVSNEYIKIWLGEKINGYRLAQYMISGTSTVKTGYVYASVW